MPIRNRFAPLSSSPSDLGKAEAYPEVRTTLVERNTAEADDAERPGDVVRAVNQILDARHPKEIARAKGAKGKKGAKQLAVGGPVRHEWWGWAFAVTCAFFVGLTWLLV